MKRTGASLTVYALEQIGARFTFGIPGVHTTELYDALNSSNRITQVLVTHEGGASFMADAVGRLYGLAHLGARIESLTRDLQIAEFLDRQTGKLSAGQKTRVALAKALINEPELLLLDEPTASLDPDTGDWVRSYLETYQRRSGATILLASHNMNEVERLCSEVMMMRKGRIVDRGSPRELIERYGRDTLEQVFLDIARAGERFDPREAAQ